jgi:CRP/FNR family transcriptional regulator, cyclic AMP receptor protein
LRTISRQHATLLSEKGWLSQIPNALRGDILNVCLCDDLDTGQTITHGGEVTGGLFGIISGTASVFSTLGPDGPLIHVAGPAFWFGLFPITNGRPRILSVIARTPCVVARLPQASLQKVLNRKPEMWRWLNSLSLESAQLAIQALTDVLINDKERRCAAALLRTAGWKRSGNCKAYPR